MPSILIIDKDETMQEAFSSVLQPLGHTVQSAASSKEGLKQFIKSPFDVVIADLDCEGISVCTEIKEGHPDTFVILTTATPRKSSVIEGIRAGASDYLIKPVGPREFLESINRVLGLDLQLPEPNDGAAGTEGGLAAAVLAGDSAASVRLREQVESIRNSRFQPSILIQAKKGSGKVHLARHLHALRRGNNAPCIELDAAQLKDVDGEDNALVRASGAPGEAFEQAEGGTLIIDQIEQLPLSLQKKLTAVCQSREENTFLICLSNVDLDGALSSGKFYISLYFQIASKVIEIPSLESRQDDIPAIASAIVSNSPKLSAAKRKLKFADSALEILKNQPWDGQIEELEDRIVDILKSHKGTKEVSETEISTLAAS